MAPATGWRPRLRRISSGPVLDGRNQDWRALLPPSLPTLLFRWHFITLNSDSKESGRLAPPSAEQARMARPHSPSRACAWWIDIARLTTVIKTMNFTEYVILIISSLTANPTRSGLIEGLRLNASDSHQLGDCPLQAQHRSPPTWANTQLTFRQTKLQDSSCKLSVNRYLILEIFMKISNLKKPLVSMVYEKNMSAF